MRRKLIVGNWKMHHTVGQSSLLVHRLGKHIKAHRDVEIILAPSLLALQPVSLELDHHKFKLAVQNAYYKDEGAFTGEVSFAMLRGLVQYALIGHSERRSHFGEDLSMVAEKAGAAMRNGITPIICIGETHTERVAGETRQVLHDQLTTALKQLTSDEVADVVVAYEPVWAIGTGVTAKPHDIESAITFIRKNLSELYGEHPASHIRVLYGAGVEPEYVGGILSLPCGIDGLLVGGASLNYHKFASIVERAHHMVQS
jgi:triosephosphate isomerase